MSERTTIIRAIQTMGDDFGNPGGKFAEAANKLLSRNHSEETLDAVEKELAGLSDDDLEAAIDDELDSLSEIASCKGTWCCCSS